MDELTKKIEHYVAAHSKAIDEATLLVLNDLERLTHLRVLMPQMLSGQLQGQWLAFFSKMVQPKTILEIGTFTGFSAICLAQGLAEGGLLHTIDINEELEPLVREYHQKAGLADRIRLHIGNAIQIIPTLEGNFDLVFIDADKLNYINYYNMVIDRVPSGGYILIDNVLWDGKVVEEKKDKMTTAIHQVNQMVQADTRVSNFLLPIRDGLMVLRKN